MPDLSRSFTESLLEPRTSLLMLFQQFKKNVHFFPLPTDSASKLMLAPCVPSSSTNNTNHSGYSYHQLSNKCDDKLTECIEMANYDDESSEQTLSNRHPSAGDKGLHAPKSPDRQVSINAAAFATHMTDESEYTGEGGLVSSRQIKIIVASFGIRLLFTALIWDHFVHKYHDALMVWSNNPEQRVRTFQTTQTRSKSVRKLIKLLQN